MRADDFLGVARSARSQLDGAGTTMDNSVLRHMVSGAQAVTGVPTFR